MSRGGPALYDPIAASYAARVDAAPFNACYERPAMVNLLPAVRNRRVLDAGCGSGWYAEQLVALGAHVTALDASPAMIAYARARLGTRAAFHVADLAQPLTWLADASTDLVIAPLVLHYLEAWGPTLREFARVLRPGGRLLFSTHHPGTEAERLSVTRYFAVEPVDETLPGVGPVRFFRRPLTAIFDALADAEFLVERVVEPGPTAALQTRDPAAFDRVSRRPAFLIVRARRDEPTNHIT
jgi:SAM-dependent methyltransferase